VIALSGHRPLALHQQSTHVVARAALAFRIVLTLGIIANDVGGLV
jgi:hypothetical protein